MSSRGLIWSQLVAALALQVPDDCDVNAVNTDLLPTPPLCPCFYSPVQVLGSF